MANQLQDFKKRLVFLEKDLREEGVEDGTIMFRIGSLAVHLIEGEGYVSWGHLKANLPVERINELMEDFVRSGNEEARFGDKRNSYALQVIGASLTCRRFPTARGLARPQQSIDKIISDASKKFRDWRKEQKTEKSAVDESGSEPA